MFQVWRRLYQELEGTAYYLLHRALGKLGMTRPADMINKLCDNAERHSILNPSQGISNHHYHSGDDDRVMTDQGEGMINVQYDPLSAGGSPDALTEEHLKRMSLLFFQLNNEQDWEGLSTADWISPRFTAAIEYRANQEREVNLQQHIAQYSQFMKENPSYIETTSEMDAKIDKFGRTAQIFINHCGNSDTGVGIPGVAVFTWWKAKSGKWLFVKMVDIRGIGS